MSKDPPRLLADRYELRAPLGEGGMGVVWRAWDRLLRQAVAIKEVSLPAWLPLKERRERLRWTLREARAAATLRGHPGIVTVYDVVEKGGLPWIVMELVEGPSLASVIRAEGRLSEARAAEIGLQVVSALSAAAAAGVVHRDVKPANILLRGDRAVLTDFGISAIAHDPSHLSGTGQVLGTPAYLAPEQIEGERASAASDLWAVGVTLYEAVEGRKPFERESVVATIAAIVSQPPASPRYVHRLRPVIDGLLGKDPAGRLTAAQVTALLAPVGAGGPPPGAASAPDARSPRGEAPASPPAPAFPRSGTPFTSPHDTALPPSGTPFTSPPGTAPTPPATAAASDGGVRRGRTRVVMAAGAVLAAATVSVTVVFWGTGDIRRRGGVDPTPGALGRSATAVPSSSGAVPSPATGSGQGSERGTGPSQGSERGTGPSQGSERGTGPSQATPGVQSPAPTGGPAPSVSGDPPPSTSGVALPRGFNLHRGDGFSVAAPDGWTRERKKEGAGGVQVTWTRPRRSILSPGDWFLGVYADPRRKETREPAAILDQLRDSLRESLFAAGSYTELNRRPVSFPGGRGAELEFGFAHKTASNLPFRLYARCVVRDSGGAGLFWFFAPAGEWAEAGTHVDTFVRTFRLD